MSDTPEVDEAFEEWWPKHNDWRDSIKKAAAQLTWTASKKAQELVWTDAPTEAGWEGYIHLIEMDQPTLAKTYIDHDDCLRVRDVDYDLSYLIVDLPEGTKFSSPIPQPKEQGS